MEITHFTSDPHYGHANIIEYCGRPFKHVDEMNETLIKNYNERVNPDDVCLWLGDCFFLPPDKAAWILSRLHGTKILIRGNHDRSAAAMARLGFALVMDEATLHIGGSTVRAMHKPDNSRTGEFIMHGHLHAPWRKRDNRLHVGVDAWGFAPAHISEIEVLINT